MSYRISVIIICILALLNFSGCKTKETQIDEFNEYVFNNIEVDIEDLKILVESNSDFEEDNDIVFKWTFEHVGDKEIHYEGTPFVEIYMKNNNGEYVDGIPNAYDSYALDYYIEAEIISEGIKKFEGIGKGKYILEVRVGWMMVDSQYIEGYGYENMIAEYSKKNYLTKDMEQLLKSYIIIDDIEIIIED